MVSQGAWLQVALPQALLQALIEAGLLCAADLRCLDLATKQAVQRLCLARCARCMRGNDAVCTKDPRCKHLAGK